MGRSNLWLCTPISTWLSRPPSLLLALAAAAAAAAGVAAAGRAGIAGGARLHGRPRPLCAWGPLSAGNRPFLLRPFLLLVLVTQPAATGQQHLSHARVDWAIRGSALLHLLDLLLRLLRLGVFLHHNDQLLLRQHLGPNTLQLPNCRGCLKRCGLQGLQLLRLGLSWMLGLHGHGWLRGCVWQQRHEEAHIVLHAR